MLASFLPSYAERLSIKERVYSRGSLVFTLLILENLHSRVAYVLSILIILNASAGSYFSPFSWSGSWFRPTSHPPGRAGEKWDGHKNSSEFVTPLYSSEAGRSCKKRE